MMELCWDQVQTLFSGDETTNFGPRNESKLALYQVDTLATISTENQVAGEVKCLVSTALGELACVAINQHLSVFTDSQHTVTLALDHGVEDCTLSPDGGLLLVVDSHGKLYIFTTSTMQSLFSINLLPSGCGISDKKAFQRIALKHDGESCDLVLLSASGVLFIVKGFDPSAFTQEGGDMASRVKQQLHTVDTGKVHFDTLDAVPLGDGRVVTAGSGDNLFALWCWQENGIFLEDKVEGIFEKDCGIVSMKLSSNNSVLCALDTQNRVSLWLVPEWVMLCCVSSSSQAVNRDFLLLDTENNSSSLQGMRLVLLEQEELSSTLRIVDVGTRQDVYSLQLGSRVCLARCPTSEESLYVVEGTPLNGDSRKISSVRLRCLTESDPETRLQRYVHKKRFTEALQFASLFQLDTEMVYTAHMNHLLEQLSPWSLVCYTDNELSPLLDQLWTSIDKIKDSHLIAEHCMRAALPSLRDTRKLLEKCSKKLPCIAGDEMEKQKSLQSKVLSLQNRLMTYMLAFGEDSFSADSWLQFQQANLLHLVCRKMTEQQPHVAILVWQRHCEEWSGKVSRGVVVELLQAVPQRMTGVSIQGWLTDDLLPYVARVLPHAMGDMAQWLVQRATNMELMEKEGWPHNAISFLEAMSRCLVEITDVDFTTNTEAAMERAIKTEIDVFAVVEPLRCTLTMLYQLKELLRYNLRLSVQQFQKETEETLAFRLLDQVVMVELLQPTLEKYIGPYMRAHGLDQDSIFATYIRDLLERVGHLRSYTGPSAWEDKVIALVSFILSPKEKCCALLNVIKHAPLPWSPEIEQIVEAGMKIQHPLVQELKDQKKMAGVRKLMQNYGIRSSQMPDQSKAETLAICIAVHGTEESLEDALWVLKALNGLTRSVDEVYFRYCNAIIREDKITDYLKLLRSLDVTKARRLAERMVLMAEICLDEVVPQPGVRAVVEQHKQQLTVAAVHSLHYILPLAAADPFEQEKKRCQLNDFTRLAALQREFKVTISMREYSDEEKRGQILVSYLQSFLKEKSPFQRTGDLSIVYRLADLLQLQREVVQGELAVKEARAGNVDAVLVICRELLEAEPSKDLGQVLPRVVSDLLKVVGQDADDDDEDGDEIPAGGELRRQLPVVLEKLACRALVVCEPELLASCLELSKAARLLKQVNAQCEAADTGHLSEVEVFDPQPTCRDPTQSYTLDTVYVDEALVMSSAVAVPLTAASLADTATFVRGEKDQEEDGEEGVSGSVQSALAHLQPVLAHLRENSHLQLALRLQTASGQALRQALLQHTMGFPVSAQVQQWLEAQQGVMQAAETRGTQLYHALLSALIYKVLSAHRVDHKLALGYMLSAPRKVSVDCLMKSIASCNFNFRRLGDLAKVGVAFGLLMREARLISTYQELEVNARWGVRLAKLKINFKDAFKGGIAAKQGIIAALANCDQADVAIVAEFCSDFKLELDDGLMVYLDRLLHNCRGPLQLSRAKAVVSAVEALGGGSCLTNTLRTVYKEINPYNYEVIEFLLREMSRLDMDPVYEKGLKLVAYLKVYTRHHPPTQSELTGDTAAQGDIGECGDVVSKLPPEASYRVPFHKFLKGEHWKVITPELDADTLPMWLQIGQLLELSLDEIYIMAVQNIVHRHVSHTSANPAGHKAPMNGTAAIPRVAPSPQWSLNEASMPLLEEVMHLMSCIQNCEMALACANWAVRELPMGGDKMLAIQGSVTFAKRWYEACDDDSPKKEKAEKAFAKFQKALRKVRTEQALHLDSLAEPALLKLVSTPLALIERLMEHPAVTAHSSDQGPRPDIFGTVRKVCEVNDIDLVQVLATAFHKWLLSSESAQDGDTTMNLSFSNLKMTDEAGDEDQSENIKRLLYFLHRGPKTEMLEFLTTITKTGEAESTSHLGRMRCLYCLQQIATDADLKPLGESRRSIREKLRVYFYLSQLEELHIQHSVQTLQDCSKTGLVKALWRKHRHQRLAVRLCAALCLDYRIHDKQQWAAVLQQMLTLNMLSDLEGVLRRLRAVQVLWSLPVFPQAWQAVLLAPLNNATLPLTDEQVRDCIRCINLLQSCPVLDQLELGVMTQHLRRLGVGVCAAACLLMDPSVPRQEVKDLLSQDLSQLLEDSYRLTALGLTLPAAVKVRKSIFQLILEQDDFHKIGQQALQDFVLFAVSAGDIDGILLFAVTNEMLPQAEALLTLYLERYPEQRDELEQWTEDCGGLVDSSLQAYLQMRKLV